MKEKLPKIKGPKEVVDDQLSKTAVRVLRNIAKEVEKSGGEPVEFELNNIYRQDIPKPEVNILIEYVKKAGWRLRLIFSHTNGTGPMEYGERRLN